MYTRNRRLGTPARQKMSRGVSVALLITDNDSLLRGIEEFHRRNRACAGGERNIVSVTCSATEVPPAGKADWASGRYSAIENQCGHSKIIPASCLRFLDRYRQMRHPIVAEGDGMRANRERTEK